MMEYEYIVPIVITKSGWFPVLPKLQYPKLYLEMFLLWVISALPVAIALPRGNTMAPWYELLDPFGLSTTLPYLHGKVLLRHCLRPSMMRTNETGLILTEDWIDIPETGTQGLVFCQNSRHPLMLPAGDLSMYPLSGHCPPSNFTCGRPEEQHKRSRVCFQGSSKQNHLKTRMTECEAHMTTANDTQPMIYLTPYSSDCSEQTGFSLSSDMRSQPQVTLGQVILLAAHEADTLQVSARDGMVIACSTRVQPPTGGVHKSSSAKLSVDVEELLRAYGLVQVSCVADDPVKQFTMSIYFFVALQTPVIKCPEKKKPAGCMVPGWLGRQSGVPSMISKDGQVRCSVDIQLCFPKIRNLSLVGHKDCNIEGKVSNNNSRYQKRNQHQEGDKFEAVGRASTRDKNSNIIVIVTSVTGGVIVLVVLGAVVVVVIMRNKTEQEHKRERAVAKLLTKSVTDKGHKDPEPSYKGNASATEPADTMGGKAVDGTLHGVASLVQQAAALSNTENTETLGVAYNPAEDTMYGIPDLQHGNAIEPGAYDQPISQQPQPITKDEGVKHADSAHEATPTNVEASDMQSAFGPK